MDLTLHIDRLVVDASLLAPGRQAVFQSHLAEHLARLISATEVGGAPGVPRARHECDMPLHGTPTPAALAQALAVILHRELVP